MLLPLMFHHDFDPTEVLPDDIFAIDLTFGARCTFFLDINVTESLSLNITVSDDFDLER